MMVAGRIGSEALQLVYNEVDGTNPDMANVMQL